jgi:hypothetical protein
MVMFTLGACGDDDASANSGTTGPRIVRGTVEIDGTIRGGEGFSAGHQGTGGFRIEFDVPFSDAPVVVVSAERLLDDHYTCNVLGVSAEQFDIRISTVNSSPTPTDAPFHFVAVAP